MRGIGGLDAGYGKLADKGWIDLSLHQHLTYRLGMDQAEFVRKLSLLKCKKPEIVRFQAPCLSSGERGIRTPGPMTVNSFQDCRIRPLCQLSATKVQTLIDSANYQKDIFLKSG